MNVFAQTPEPLGTIGGEGFGPFGKIGQGIARNSAAGGVTGLTAVTKTVSSIIGIMTIAAGIWFMFQLLTGGFFWMTSAGDKAKLETARHRINDAFVGLLIVVAGWAILALAGQFLGFDILVTSPGEVINQLSIPGR